MVGVPIAALTVVVFLAIMLLLWWRRDRRTRSYVASPQDQLYYRDPVGVLSTGPGKKLDGKRYVRTVSRTRRRSM
jgi:ABC-type transport system involved in cytochrome c biogenesis permease subunit